MVDMSTARVPPNAREAEKAVLGGVLLENDAMNVVMETLGADDFYSEANSVIFDCMVSLFRRGQPVDTITLRAELVHRSKLQAVGGDEYLLSLTDTIPTVTNIEAHANIVREKATIRNLITACHEIAAQGYGDYGEMEEFLDAAERAVFTVAKERLRHPYEHIKTVILEEFKKINEAAERGEEIIGLPTGFDRLDKMTAGLKPGELIIIAGRPGMGKTAFALNVAVNAAIQRKQTVAVFSLEMAKAELVRRMLASEARVDGTRMRTGKINRDDWPKLANAAGVLSELPVWVDDTPALSLMELRAKARRLKSEQGLQMVIVDYLQLMRSGMRHDSREQEISEISRSLKALSKELSLPVIALSQLNRGVESRGGDKRPQLSDLRECVPGDTLVLLADGRRVPIAALVGEAPRVLAVERGGVVEAAAEVVWKVGRRPVFELRLASGRTVRATGEHRFLGATGFREVRDLAPGDRLATARRLPEPATPDRWPEDRVALLGQLIGDGSYLRGQPMRYTTASEDNSALVARAATAELGATVKRYAGRRGWHQLLISGNGNRWHPAGVNRWLRELGVFGQRSHEKRVPPAAFRLAGDQIATLLRHLWATDGTIYAAPRGKRTGNKIAFTTSSPGLAGDVRALLLRVGVVSRIYVARQGEHRPAHHVVVSGAPHQRAFLERVGAFGPRVEQAARLRRRLATIDANTNTDTLPVEVFAEVKAAMAERGVSQRRMAAMRGTAYGGHAHFAFAPSRATLAGYADLLDDDGLRARATDDLFWDRVVAIEPAGEEDVFDLTVPGPACWLADGVVSHNSGAIEQDADVIMFVFREEVYNREDPAAKGIAEVIVGKQRAGPTGVVKCRFFGEYTRFDNLADDYFDDGGGDFMDG